jgi:predicted PhzF superfamily epimerase YddE/YHI9
MYQVDAFATRLFEGNPAAVLLLEDWLPDGVLQAIAAENNLAETAFARRNAACWDLRWFTPVHEVDFCGHATLATAHVLAAEEGHPGPFKFSTRVGEIVVRRHGPAYQLDIPCFPPEPLGALASEVGELANGAMISGFRNFENVFAELGDESAVRSFVPDLPRIALLGEQGLVITARGDGHDFVSRYFAPGSGIPEDPVTGSTHATLVPYWASKLGKKTLSAFQCSARGGRLDCELAGARVVLTGNAVTFMKAEIRLPE